MRYHAKIVKEKALRRRLIDVAQGLVQEAHESPSDANELIDLAEHRIFQVSQQRGGEGFTRIKELLWPAMERIEQLREGGPLTGVPSGFVDLDRLTLGFQPSDLIIVTARPSISSARRGSPPVASRSWARRRAPVSSSGSSDTSAPATVATTRS